MSQRLIDSHWSNNYGGSVRALNETKRRLADALADRDLPPYIYNDLKREHLMRTGSVVLHELYFENLGGNGRADDAARSWLAGGFGQFDRWEAEFRRIANGLGGGSGWVIFALTLAPLVALAEVVDFEDTDGKTPPSGWQFTMTDQGGAPRWEIVNDPTSPMGPSALAQLSEDRTSGRFPLAIYEDTEIVDGVVSVRFKPVSGSVDQAAGLVWRYRDENNYYIARANALEDNVVLYKVENGRRIPLGPVGRGDDYGVKHDVPGQQWSALGVAFDGDKFTVLFNEQPLFDVVDATFKEAGKVGLWTKADSVTYFDAFEVEERQ